MSFKNDVYGEKRWVQIMYFEKKNFIEMKSFI